MLCCWYLTNSLDWRSRSPICQSQWTGLGQANCGWQAQGKREGKRSIRVDRCNDYVRHGGADRSRPSEAMSLRICSKGSRRQSCSPPTPCESPRSAPEPVLTVSRSATEQQAKTASTSSFVTALVLNAAIFGIEIVAFTILRRSFPAIYEPRSRFLPEG